MSKTAVMKAKVYITDAEGKDFWAEMENAQVIVERTDSNEVRIGVTTRGDIDDCSIYLTDYEATRVAQAVDEAIDIKAARTDRLPVGVDTLHLAIWDRIAQLAGEATPGELMALIDAAQILAQRLPADRIGVVA